jgi:lysozyme family protein
MKNNFNDCLKRVLKDEGGYSNVKGDNGGPTDFGITLGDYRKYINPRGTAADVKNMEVGQAETIYRQKYWDVLDCDSLAAGVDYTCFDYGVNSGIGRPRNALNKFKDKTGKDLINAINDERVRFLRKLAATEQHDQQFLAGWLSRVSRVRQYSLQLAGTVPQAPKATVGILAGIAAMFGRGKEAIIAHPYISVGVAIGVAVIAYTIFHYIHKAVKNGS